MFAPGAEGVEGPEVLHFIVAKDVEVAVVGAHAEVTGAWGVPLVLDFRDVEGAAAKREALRALVSAKASVAVNANLAHSLPQAEPMTASLRQRDLASSGMGGKTTGRKARGLGRTTVCEAGC